MDDNKPAETRRRRVSADTIVYREWGRLSMIVGSSGDFIDMMVIL